MGIDLTDIIANLIAEQRMVLLAAEGEGSHDAEEINRTTGWTVDVQSADGQRIIRHQGIYLTPGELETVVRRSDELLAQMLANV